jgi:tetratricopeptide (TPR) repeat protein
MGINTKESLPWNPFHLGLISYFCIILPGGFYFAQNYQLIGLPQRKLPFQLITVSWFLVFIFCVAFLPDNWFWLAELVHIAFPVSMILLQYPHYNNHKEQSAEDLPNASIQKPTLLSVLFALILFAGIAARDWYYQYSLEQKMGIAQDAYLEGRFAESISVLRDLEPDYPDERTVYINLALSYHAAGKTDSAIFALRRWLKHTPEDQEASDMLYHLRYGIGKE